MPLANTCTRNNTVPSQPRRWASDGESGAGVFRYAALAEDPGAGREKPRLIGGTSGGTIGSTGTGFWLTQ